MGIHYVSEGPHKDGSTSWCECERLCDNVTLSFAIEIVTVSY